MYSPTLQLHTATRWAIQKKTSTRKKSADKHNPVFFPTLVAMLVFNNTKMVAPLQSTVVVALVCTKPIDARDRICGRSMASSLCYRYSADAIFVLKAALFGMMFELVYPKFTITFLFNNHEF